MKIDTGKITGFDEMSAEDKLKALLEFEIEDKDETEITRVKNALSKANSEAAEYKRKLHEKMSDEEKAKEAAAAAQKELEDKYNALLREKTLSETKSKYMALGMEQELAMATAEASLNGDTDKVFANLEAFKKSFEKSVRAKALDDTPKPGAAGKGTKSVTKEEFDKMSYSEIVKLRNENPELYESLMNS